MSEDKGTPPADESQKDTPQTGEKPEEKGSEGSEGDDKVEITKKEHDELIGLKKRQAELTKREQRISKKEESRKKRSQSNSSTNGKFSHEEPEEEDEPDVSELARQEAAEFTKVKIGVSELLVDNDEIRSVVKSNKTLVKILKKDPLALLDETPIDAEDALEKIEEFLQDLADEKGDDKEDGSSGKDKNKKKAPKPVPQKKDEGNKNDDKKKKKSSTTVESVEGSILDRLG